MSEVECLFSKEVSRAAYDIYLLGGCPLPVTPLARKELANDFILMGFNPC